MSDVLLGTVHALLQCTTCEEAPGIKQSQYVMRVCGDGSFLTSVLCQGCPDS